MPRIASHPMRMKLRTRRNRASHRPALRFTPTAWAKLIYLRDLGPTEVGGFGISNPSDLLRIEDLQLVPQTASSASVKFDDSAVADFFDRQIDMGRLPAQFARIWIHTHPGQSAEPSAVDEETFSRVFGGCDWAVMAILARGGQAYARLQFEAGPGGDIRIPVTVDYSAPFAGSDHADWQSQYVSSVRDEMTSVLNWFDDCLTEQHDDQLLLFDLAGRETPQSIEW